MYRSSMIHRTLAVLSMFLSALASAQTPTTSIKPTYNFAYRIAGDNVAAPIQAFDDGRRLFVQFRDLKLMPALFADTPGGRLFLKPGVDYDIDAPYVVLRRIEPDLVLVLGRHQASLHNDSAAPGSTGQAPAMFGSAAPISVSGTLPAPISAGNLTAAHRDQNAPALSAQGGPNDPTTLRKSLSPKEEVVAVSAPHPLPTVATTSSSGAMTRITLTPNTVQTVNAEAAATAIPKTPVLTQVKPLNSSADLPHFVAAKGDWLSHALRIWATSAGWTLTWDAPSTTSGKMREFVMEDDTDIPVTDVNSLLQYVLTGRSLQASTYPEATPKRIVINNADLTMQDGPSAAPDNKQSEKNGHDKDFK